MGVVTARNILLGLAKTTYLSAEHKRKERCRCKSERLADINKKFPNIKNVKEAWKKLVFSEAKNIRFILSKMNTSQLKVITYIALGNKTELTSKNTQKVTDLSSTAISKALEQLKQDDLLERDERGGYSIIDPLVKDIIITYESDLIDLL